MKRTTHSPITRITLLGFLLSFAQPVFPTHESPTKGQEPTSYVITTEALKKLMPEKNPWNYFIWGGIACFALLAALGLMTKSKKAVLKPTIHTETLNNDYAGPVPEEIAILLQEIESKNRSLYKGFLFHGPHGCGKTHLVRCISGSTQIPVKELQASDVLESWYGVAERRIQSIFADARALVADIKNNPSGRVIVFLDKINDFARKRKGNSLRNDQYFDTIINTIAQELDKTEQNKGLIVIGCTDNPLLIDSTLTSAGRLSTHVTVGLPDEETREELFSHYVMRSKVPHVHAGNPAKLTPALKQLAQSTPNKTPADIREYLEEAARTAPHACKKAFGTSGHRLGTGESLRREPVSKQGKARQTLYAVQQITVQPGTQATHTSTPVLTNQFIIDVIDRKKAQRPVGYIADISE